MTTTIRPINKLLIANRSEIALRITRSAQAMGIHCLAIYSPADANSLHVQHADEAAPLKGDQAAESYLDIQQIIHIAKTHHCDAIHPGYGFLAENAAFAQACDEAGIVFIGPDAKAITLMGDKSRSKSFAKEHGIPVIPGEENLEQSLDAFTAFIEQHGLPVLIKASAGGGGKGMKLVRHMDEVDHAFNSAKREAMSAFGNDHLLIEKYFEQARHVEVQVLADQHGQVVHLFDRDCSLQRRHQKVIEEAPAFGIGDGCRQSMYDCAIKLCRLIDYRGAGTLEFLLDEKENFYLMEMNTRLQVEHAVSEQITGIDIVAEQIRIAEGKPLSMTQADIHIQGHSIEARLYAEQYRNDFLPASGNILALHLPEQSQHVRIDHALQETLHIGSLYDPMIGKIACWGKNRNVAIESLANALSNTLVLGVDTNRNFLKACLLHDDFRNNRISTRFIEEKQASLIETANPQSQQDVDWYGLIQTLFNQANQKRETLYYPERQYSPWYTYSETRNRQQLSLVIDDKALPTKDSSKENTVEIDKADLLAKNCLKGRVHNSKNPEFHGLFLFTQVEQMTALAIIKLACSFGDIEVTVKGLDTGKIKQNQAQDANYRAPLNGRIVSVKVKDGDHVHEGQSLMVMEAMKMEHNIKARSSGQVDKLKISEGEQVTADQFLFSITSNEE